MRTVEQVAADYAKAEETVKSAEAARHKFRVELEEIHAAVRQALGLRE